VHPRSAADFDRLRRYADALDADVVAFEEVDGAGAASRVFSPDRYAIVITGDTVVQRVGFAIRRGLAFTRNPDVTAIDVQPEAHFPLRSGADVTLDLPHGQRLRLLAVHLKSGCWSGPMRRSRHACRALHEQIAPLADWISRIAAAGTPFVVLGDFNRRMEGHDRLFAALDRAAPLLRTTAGQASPCWGGDDFIDHILAGGQARNWVEPDSLRVLVYRETDPAWKDRLSDHCPVSVRLDVPG